MVNSARFPPFQGLGATKLTPVLASMQSEKRPMYGAVIKRKPLFLGPGRAGCGRPEVSPLRPGLIRTQYEPAAQNSPSSVPSASLIRFAERSDPQSHPVRNNRLPRRPQLHTNRPPAIARKAKPQLPTSGLQILLIGEVAFRRHKDVETVFFCGAQQIAVSQLEPIQFCRADNLMFYEKARQRPRRILIEEDLQCRIAG